MVDAWSTKSSSRAICAPQFKRLSSPWGQFEVSHLRWEDAAQRLTHTGAEVGFANGEAVEVVGKQ